MTNSLTESLNALKSKILKENGYERFDADAPQIER